MHEQLKAFSHELKLLRKSVQHSKELIKKAQEARHTGIIEISSTISIIRSSIKARENRIKYLEERITLLLI